MHRSHRKTRHGLGRFRADQWRAGFVILAAFVVAFAIGSVILARAPQAEPAWTTHPTATGTLFVATATTNTPAWSPAAISLLPSASDAETATGSSAAPTPRRTSPRLTPKATPSPTSRPTATPSPIPTPAPTASPTPAPARLVTLGDSLTYGTPGVTPWPALLAAMDPRIVLAHNAGIGGDTTKNMLARFTTAVLAYDPAVVTILGGANDMTARIAPEVTLANLGAIVDACKARGMVPILILLPPRSDAASLPGIATLNEGIVALGKTKGVAVVDIHTPLAAPDGTYIAKYTIEGVHFTAAGQAVVASVVADALGAAGY